MFIYLIRNLVNGKIYVGQTVRTLKQRLYFHFADSRRYHGGGPRLHRAIRKYGSNNFTIELLATATTAEEMNTLECLWIANLQSTKPAIGYNCTPGGDRPPSTIGRKWSARVRARMRKAAIKRGISPATRQKMAAGIRGKKQTAAANAKRSAALNAYWKNNPAARAQRGVAIRKAYERPEVQANYEAAMANPIVRAKQSANRKGTKHTQEWRAQRSAAQKGKPMRNNHCKHGHPLTADNLVLSDLSRGIRRCLTCTNQRRNQQ